MSGEGKNNIKKIKFDYVVISRTRMLDDLDAAYQIKAHQYYEKDDLYIMAKDTLSEKEAKRFQSLWRISSSYIVDTLNLEDHVSAIVNIISKNKDKAQELVECPECTALFQLSAILIADVAGVSMNSRTWQEVFELSERVDIRLDTYNSEDEGGR